LHCVACNGKYLISGSETYVFVWYFLIFLIKSRDVRSLKLLKTLKPHCDEVTSICLHPTNKNVWLTCGLDELLCQYDMEQDDIIDFSIFINKLIKKAVRSEQPLNFCGFFGENFTKQFTATGSHSLELYDEVGNLKTIERENVKNFIKFDHEIVWR